jgi:hypothetical protein
MVAEICSVTYCPEHDITDTLIISLQDRLVAKIFLIASFH